MTSPRDSEQFLTAFFGTFEFEKNFEVHDHPWMSQLKADILLLSVFDDIAWCIEELADNPRLLLVDLELREEFLKFDVGQLRGIFNTVALPMWEHPDATIQPKFDVTGPRQHKGGSFECNLKCQDENTCTMTFETQQALLQHQYTAMYLGGEHATMTSLSKLVKTNQCPFCKTIFASTQIASNHVRHAFTHDRCLTEQTTLQHSLNDISEDIQCDLLRKHLNNNESCISLNKLQLAHLSTRTTKKHPRHYRQYLTSQTQLV